MRPMSRITQIFTDLRANGRKAIMPFVTAGYPSLEATAAMLPAIEAAGASVVELGIPFSDPIADGPVIAASMTEALRADVSPGGVFDMVRSVRGEVSMGLVAMVSYSIVHRMGAANFVRDAADAGLDGFIFPDLPLDEAADVSAIVNEAGLTSSLLIAPTTTDDRAAEIAKASTGFVYVVARTGITGARAELPAGLTDRLTKLRGAADLPMAVGFGISSPEHVAQVTSVADAAIVGSALVKQIGAHIEDSPSDLAAHVGDYVANLATGLGKA